VPTLIGFTYFSRKVEVMSVEMETLVVELNQQMLYGALRANSGPQKRRRRRGEPRGAFQSMNFAVRKRRAPLIIIVSLVDILIILLIFFVVSTTFKKDQPEIQINCRNPKRQRSCRRNSST